MHDVTPSLPPASAAPVVLRYAGPPSAVWFMACALAPRRRRAAAPRPMVARWSGHRVLANALATYTNLSGMAARAPGDPVPLLYPLAFGFRLAMALLTHPTFPRRIWNVLQIRNHVASHRPIAPDAVLDLETRAVAYCQVAAGLEIEMHSRAVVSSDVAWESVVTFLARGRAPGAGPPAPLARGPGTWGGPVARWTMQDTGHLRFGAITGDYNGLHLSDAYARRLGFRRAFYHPVRVLGHCLARLPSIDGPTRLDAWLKGPVPHGAPVELWAEGAGPGAGRRAFALFVEPKRPAIVGQLGALDGPLTDCRGVPVAPTSGPRRVEPSDLD